MATSKPQRNPALRLLGLPMLPSKLPSRNWLIFWSVTTSLTAAIIYDAREKRRATARWTMAVAPLAQQPLPNPSALPRRVVVYLEAPPGDVLRSSQDHFFQYVKPILASSGLDWEFVLGRRQGDVRAVVAERIRRSRRLVEQDFGGADTSEADEEDAVDAVRKRNGIPQYDGIKGDIVIGRHTWKEYVRGIHEGWLGPLSPPPLPEPTVPSSEPEAAAAAAGTSSSDDQQAASSAKEAEEKSKKPIQPPPYNTPEQYPTSALSRFVPAELGPSAAVPFPHLLGFLNTPIRLYRFMTRRYLADEIGREIASVCFAVHRPYGEMAGEGDEQQNVLLDEERDWVKSVWKTSDKEKEAESSSTRPEERIWASPIVTDSRIASRMHKFVLTPEEEARSRQIAVPEEKVEGWTKGKLRALGRWVVLQWKGDKKQINVGNLDDE